MLFLYVIFFLFWCGRNYIKYGFNVSTFLLSLYLLSSVCSIILVYNYQTYSIERINSLAVLTHLFCYFLFFLPVINFGNRKIKNIRFPDFKYLKFLLYIIIALSLCTFVASIPKIGNAFSYSNLAEARKLHNLGELNDESGGGVIEYLGGIGNNLSFYSLFLAFWLFSVRKKIDWLILILFISSFAIVLNNIAFMGRDGIVRWIMFFLFSFICFKDDLSKEFKKKLLKISAIPSAILIYVFYLISSSRFGDRGHGVVYSFVDYLGQSNIYFSYGFDQFIDGVAGGKINFSYIVGERVSLNNLNQYVYADYHLNTFSSFVGSLYFDMGLFSTLVIAFVVFLVLSIYNLIGKNSFYKLILFLVFFEIYMLGLFYYMFYGPTKINSVVLLFGLAVGVAFIARNKVGKI